MIIQEIIAILDKRFPGLAQHLERSDIATPATFVRYTGNWQGSYEGWLPTPRILGRRIPYTLPGLKDFYMAGHWVVAGGGLPSAALSGRYVAQMICAQNGKVFAASQAVKNRITGFMDCWMIEPSQSSIITIHFSMPPAGRGCLCGS